MDHGLQRGVRIADGDIIPFKLTVGGEGPHHTSQLPAHRAQISESSVNVVLSAAFTVEQRGGSLEERNVWIFLQTGRELTTRDSTLSLSLHGLVLFVSPHRTYSLTVQLPVHSCLPFESSPVTLLDDVEGLLGQKSSWMFQVYLADSLKTPSGR